MSLLQSMTEYQIISLILRVISTIGILFAGFSLFVAYRSYKDSHEWNRRRYSMELLENYREIKRVHAEQLTQFFKGLFSDDTAGKMSKSEAKSLWFINKGLNKDPKYLIDYSDEELLDLRNHVISYLNYMEIVCTAYENHVVDQNIIYEAFEGIYINRYEFFEEFIKVAQSELSEKCWLPIQRVLPAWIKRSKPKKRKNKLIVPVDT